MAICFDQNLAIFRQVRCIKIELQLQFKFYGQSEISVFRTCSKGKYANDDKQHSKHTHTVIML
jgi:hypothetical protein